jgi:heme A synthase
MIETIFHAHSGLRFLVLLAAVVALIVQALGVFGRQPYGRPSRISMAVFSGLLDLQVLLGIVMVVLGCFYGALMGHLLVMVLAAGALHGCSVYARKQADGRRAHTVALVGVVLALALMVGGISAIGRTPVTRSDAPTCAAAHR